MSSAAENVLTWSGGIAVLLMMLWLVYRAWHGSNPMGVSTDSVPDDPQVQTASDQQPVKPKKCTTDGCSNYATVGRAVIVQTLLDKLSGVGWLHRLHEIPHMQKVIQQRKPIEKCWSCGHISLRDAERTLSMNRTERSHLNTIHAARVAAVNSGAIDRKLKSIADVGREQVEQSIELPPSVKSIVESDQKVLKLGPAKTTVETN